MTAGQRRIRELALREYREEQRAADQHEPANVAAVDQRDGEHDFEHNDQISTIRFTCNLFDDDVILTKSEVKFVFALFHTEIFVSNGFR